MGSAAGKMLMQTSISAGQNSAVYGEHLLWTALVFSRDPSVEPSFGAGQPRPWHHPRDQQSLSNWWSVRVALVAPLLVQEHVEAAARTYPGVV